MSLTDSSRLARTLGLGFTRTVWATTAVLVLATSIRQARSFHSSGESEKAVTDEEIDELVRDLEKPALDFDFRNASYRLREIGPPAVAPLCTAIKKRQGDAVGVAIAILADIGDRRAVPTLVDFMNGKEHEAQPGAAQALGRIGSPKAVQALIEALNHKNADVRKRAALGLGEIGPPAVAPLCAAVKKRQEDGARRAIEILGEIGNRKAVPALVDFMNGKEHEAQPGAARALGRIGSPQAVQALIEALKHKNADVRLCAARALPTQLLLNAVLEDLEDGDDNNDTFGQGMKIGDPKGIPHLVKILKTEVLKYQECRDGADKSVHRTVVRDAADALAGSVTALKRESIGVRRKAAQELIDLLDLLPDLEREGYGGTSNTRGKPGDVSSEGYRSACFTAINASGEIGDPKATPHLCKVLKDKDFGLRLAAAEALGRIGDPEAIPALIEALIRDRHSRETGVRLSPVGAFGVYEDSQVVARRQETIRTALAQIGQPAVPELMRMLEGSTPGRGQAALVLAEIGYRRMIPLLVRLVEDEEQWLEHAVAAEALGRLKATEAVPALLEALQDERTRFTEQPPGTRSTIVDNYPRLTRGSAIIKALAEIGDPRAVTPLCDALGDKTYWPFHRFSICEALVQMGDPRAVAALCGALDDEFGGATANWAHNRRADIAESLGHCGSMDAIKPLMTVIKTEHRNYAAEEAVERIYGARSKDRAVSNSPTKFNVRVDAVWLRNLTDKGTGVRCRVTAKHQDRTLFRTPFTDKEQRHALWVDINVTFQYAAGTPIRFDIWEKSTNSTIGHFVISLEPSRTKYETFIRWENESRIARDRPGLANVNVKYLK